MRKARAFAPLQLNSDGDQEVYNRKISRKIKSRKVVTGFVQLSQCGYDVSEIKVQK